MSLDISLYYAGEEENTFADLNVTHNLSHLASVLGVYPHIWKPKDLGIERASELIGPLYAAINNLLLYNDYYKKFNSPNGYGTTEDMITFLRRYRNACIINPNASIKVMP